MAVNTSLESTQSRWEQNKSHSKKQYPKNKMNRISEHLNVFIKDTGFSQQFGQETEKWETKPTDEGNY